MSNRPSRNLHQNDISAISNVLDENLSTKHDNSQRWHHRPAAGDTTPQYTLRYATLHYTTHHTTLRATTYSERAICRRLSTFCGFSSRHRWNISNDCWIFPSERSIRPYRATVNTINRQYQTLQGDSGTQSTGSIRPCRVTAEHNQPAVLDPTGRQRNTINRQYQTLQGDSGTKSTGSIRPYRATAEHNQPRQY